MANKGKGGTNSSQFYITFKPTPSLDGQNTIFGEVLSGFDTITKIELAGNKEGENVPKRPVVI